MKFLCGNCKAKYQIADAKVAGRTLRMKCRRCGHDILIQGEGGGAQPRVGGSTVSMPPSPGRGGGARKPPPVPPPAPSALGAGFRRGLTGASEPPKRAVHDQWHVAIHDVPVGPMSREELARKIAAGAAGPQSLCWREGMDDWRPLEDVAELAALLNRGGGSRQGMRPVPVGGRLGAGPPLMQEEYDDEFGEPTRVADASMRAPGSGLSAAPSTGSGMFAGSPTPPPSVAPEPSQPAVAAGRPQMSPWALIGIGMAIAMGLLGGPFIIMRLLESPAPPQAAVAPTPAAPVEAPRQAVPEVDVADIEAEPVEDEEVEDEIVAEPSQPARAKTTTKKPSGSTSSNGKHLTEEQKKLLARMGGDTSAAPSAIRGSGGGGGGGGGGGQSLNAAQLTSVVKRNRPGLQRCYEAAMRATASTDTLRINVKLTVGMSGTVTRVSATGASMGSLTSCIERTVKRWRFPSSGGSTEFEFPVLFQPGG